MPRSAHHAALLAICVALGSACQGDGPVGAPETESAYLEIRIQPGEARVGSSLAVQPVIEVRDHRGRLVMDAIPVTVSVSNGAGMLLGTPTVTALDGVARFTDLGLSGVYGPNSLAFSAPGFTPVVANAVDLRPPLRSLHDRPDDIAGPQVHVIYVLPLGATDRHLDTELDIANSVAVLQAWFARATGSQIRFDRYDGVLDVSFFELSRSDSDMRSLGSYIVTEIESQLSGAGIIREDKRYLVYYDGGSTSVCGGAAWPPTVTGHAAALYIRACGALPLAGRSDAAPGYWEFAALHDLIHTLGVVSAAAPHHTSDRPAHVPEPNDLMYGGGPAAWEPTTVDIDGDDYFAPSLTNGLANLAASPFLERVAAAAAAPPSSSVTGRPLISTSLPPHQPLIRR